MNRESFPKSHMNRAIELYESGVLSKAECFAFLCKLAVEAEVDKFISVCPQALMADLVEWLSAYGDDEANWPETISTCCYPPRMSSDEINEVTGKSQEAIWNGVRILKPRLLNR